MPRTKNSRFKSLLKGLIFAILATFAGMLLIAALIVWLDITDSTVKVLNQILKAGAIILGTCTAVKRGGEMGLATGTLLALIYMALGYSMYMALGGGIFNVAEMLGEMLVGSAIGAVTGTIRANMTSARRRS